MNGLTPPPFDNDQEDDDRKPAAVTVTTSDQKQSPYEHYANLPINHLAVIKIKAWSPSAPSITHLFTCTVNIAHDDGMLHSNKRKNRKDSLGFISEENEEDDDEDDIGSDDIGRRDSLVHGPSFIQGRQNKEDDMYAGSLVGLYRPHSSSNNNDEENNNDTSTWNVDDTFHIQKVHFIPHTQIQSQLIHLLKQNDARLQTLIMDGLPPSTFFHDTTTVSEFTYALESNTSVQSLSLNYSHVNDDLGNALASSSLLRNNTTLKHLSLVGNRLSSVTAKQFFNLIHNNSNSGGGRRGSLRRNSIGSNSGNYNNSDNNNNEISLQSLDLGENPDMDRDILEAVHQFMEQRELKRRLSSSLSIMSRDNDTNNNNNNNDDDDAINYNHVTVVCHESILNGGNYDSQSVQLEEASIQSSKTALPEMETMPDLSPLPNESFMHYVNRVNPTTKKSAIKTVMAHQRLYAAVAQDGNANNDDDGNGILNNLDTSSSISSNPNHQRGSNVNNNNGPFITQEEKDARLKSDRKSFNKEDSQVGITHVNEVAPGRQSRTSRMRRTMTDSQRRLRLQSFTDVDDSARRMEDDNDNNHSNRAFSRMKTQESDYYYDNESLEEGGNALKNVFGLDDPEVRIDFCLCGCMCCLFLLVMVMVIVYVTAF